MTLCSLEGHVSYDPPLIHFFSLIHFDSNEYQWVFRDFEKDFTKQRNKTETKKA